MQLQGEAWRWTQYILSPVNSAIDYLICISQKCLIILRKWTPLMDGKKDGIIRYYLFSGS